MELAELMSTEVPCERCAKEMALQHVYLSFDKLCSVAYKCLSCGYEEIRPYVTDADDTA